MPKKVIVARRCVQRILAEGPFVAPGFEPFSGIVFESSQVPEWENVWREAKHEVS